jgi:AcrR family transcriptional regulator
MTRERRSYQMKKRAETAAQTRERIVASAAELHATLGPAQTTISAIANHAGVRRSTVYRHFHDEAAVIVACSIHWQTENQPPDPGRWAALENADERLETALTEIYAYYATTGLMLDNVFRDEATMPILTELLGRFRGYMAAARDILMVGRPTRGAARRRTSAVVGHALDFTTWRSLTCNSQLTEKEAAGLMVQLAATAAHHEKRRRQG